VHELASVIQNLESKNVQQSWHHALSARDAVTTQFNLGLITLRQRAVAEELFWEIASQIHDLVDELQTVPDELSSLGELLADTYTTNFSIFQSVPDAWAISQRFPIMPIHRLNEKPQRQAVLADLTCDSDGKVDQFISGKRALPLHELNGHSYRIGFFLVGAYQEILGDLHNLFGDTHAAHVRLNGSTFTIDGMEEGDTVSEVLNYVHFDSLSLMQKIEASANIAIARNMMAPDEKEQLVGFYSEALHGYTYFE
jgi:arginine decarboxylase